jgi:hypothetical protein
MIENQFFFQYITNKKFKLYCGLLIYFRRKIYLYKLTLLNWLFKSITDAKLILVIVCYYTLKLPTVFIKILFY